MENKLELLPAEVKDLSLKVPEEKREEVNNVLNDVFKGTSDWKNQIDAIEVKGINDKMSIKLADAARLNAKNARLHAEKIFDAKRSEVQAKMQDYKTEDALWLKAKQTMQILFKDIEDTAKWKADTIKRHEQEQRELRNKLRYEKALKFVSDESISMIEINAMSDDSFKYYLTGIEKEYNDRIEAEQKAEKERLENERLENLNKSRKNAILNYWSFVDDKIKDDSNFSDLTEIEWNYYVQSLKQEKEKYDKEQYRIKKENERLQKEAEEKEKQRQVELKKQEEKQQKEREEYQSKLRAEQEEKQRIQNELKAKEDTERKAKEDEEKRIQAELSKGDTAKVNDLINDLESLKTKYNFKSKRNKKTYEDVKILIDKVINHIKVK